MATAPRATRDPDDAARRAQLVRGVGAVSLTVTAAAAGAMALDSGLELSGWVRGLLLAAWLGLAGALVWQWVVKPLSAPLPRSGGRPTVGSAARAAFAAVALLTPLGFIPGAGERVRRFLLPWYTPLPDVPFHVVVSSGNPVVARGQPVTLAAYLDRVRPNGPLPETATLVLRPASAKAESREPMTAEGSAAFRYTRPAVADDFEYCIEAGGLRSDWYAVAVADPVNLADGTVLTVRPPEYAEGVVPARTPAGFHDFEAMPAGRVTATLRFTRPAADARLEWRLGVSRNDAGTDVTLRLEPDRTGGTAELTIPGNGLLVLTLTGDRGLRTEWPAVVRVTPDAPPRFETVAGVTGTVRDARPDDRVPIELAAVDDVQVASVRVEYRLVGRESDVRNETVQLAGLRTKRVEGAFAFALAGKVREGETIQFRLRVSDNRSVPSLRLAPQDAVFPPDGWATLRITPAARPLAEQEVFGQRDRVRARLTAAAGRATEAAKAVAAVREANPADGPLAVDHVVRLRSAWDEVGQAAADLDAVAGEVGLTPTLRPFAADIKSQAADPLRAAAPILKSAEADPTRASRGKSLADAAGRVAAALSALAELTARNEVLAGTRFDRHHLLELAADQLALADDAGRPDAKPGELASRQQDLSARLNQLVASSDRLRAAVGSAAGDELRTFHDRVRQLADGQAALNQAIAETELRARALRLEDLVRRQRDLADRAARFGERTETAARVARAAPLPRAPFDAGVNRLTAGKAIEALSEQVKAAWELERLAEALARAADARRDRREAARQVALWQDDLRSRLDDAVHKAPARALPEHVRKRFADEQRAVRDAADRLRQPNPDPAAVRAEDAVKKSLEAACAAFENTPAEAAAAVKQAAGALDKYAEQMPGTVDRVKRAKVLIEQIRRDQTALSREADDAIATLPGPKLGEKLESLAKSMADLAARVRALDLPGHESRRDAAVAAALRAGDDLRAGFTTDVPVSQQDLHRRLDRLRQAADGQTTPDETGFELAQLTKALTDAASRLPPRPTADDLKPLQQTQREIQRLATGLVAPEYAHHLSEVRRAVEEAGAALRPGEPVIELRRSARRAAEAAATLADRLGAAETDVQRVARLARERAEQAKAGKPASPEALAAVVRGIDRQLEELALVRARKSAAARKAAADALKLLRQATDPDRCPALQQAAADALQRLAAELASHEDRGAAGRLVPVRADADDLRSVAGNGRLPTAEDAGTARELARLQTALQNATSEAVAELARGTRPAERDDLGPLAKEQADVAAACHKLARSLGSDSPAFRPCSEAAEHLTLSAAALSAGAVDAAKREALTAKSLLATATRAVDPHSGASARLPFFSVRQAQLAERIGRISTAPPVEAARQRARQAELAAGADRLAESIRDAGVPTDPEAPLAHALAGIVQTQGEMAQADRDAGGERPTAAAAARARAAGLFTRTANALEGAIRALPPSAQSAEVGVPLRSASVAMRRAEAQLARPNGTGEAGASMRAPVEAVSRAVELLTESMTKTKRTQ